MKYLLFFIFLSLAMFRNGISQDSLSNGDWAHKYEILANTPEADLMVRTGDIDNLGFGWPVNFDPFSGASTPTHYFPWAPDTLDPDGTDRIMVISSYDGHPPAGTDGYTYDTSRPENSVRLIMLTYALDGLTVNSAMLQIFVDDFQAPVWGAQYQVSLDGVRIPGLETIINDLQQTGPIGRIVKFPIPDQYLDLLADDTLSILFDDFTTGAGDGYAIDFIKLLINPSVLNSYGTITGTILDQNTRQPISGVKIIANGGVSVLSATDGIYTIDSVLTGFVTLQTFASGFGSQAKTVILEKDQTVNVDFFLLSPAPVPLSFWPEENAFNVPLADSVVVDFDVAIDSNTVNAFSFYLQTSDSTIPGSFRFDGTKIIFRPAAPLPDDATYRVTLNTNIKNQSGIALEENVSWKFSTGAPTAIGRDGYSGTRSFELFPAYPNPFNPATTVRYKLLTSGMVQLDVYDISGKKIQNLLRQYQTTGTYNVSFDGGRLTSGVYFVQLRAGGFHKTRKIILLK